MSKSDKMKWKVLLSKFEEEFGKHGCTSKSQQRDEVIDAVVDDITMREQVKDVLNEFCGFCVCEVFFNAIEGIDEESLIPTTKW